MMADASAEALTSLSGFSWSLLGGDRTRPRPQPRHHSLAVWMDRAMVVAGLLVCVAIFLQASLITANKSSENVSMPSYILLVIASLLWMCYGILWNDGLVALSGVVFSAGTIFALVASVSYMPHRTAGAFSTL